MPPLPPGPSGSPGPAGTATYRERVWPSWWVWAVVAGFGGSVGLSLLPVLGQGAAAVTALLVAAGAGAALVRWTPLVAVEDGELRAGPARVPLHLVARAEPLRAQDARRALGTQLDARAYLCVRGWVPHVVRVHLDDPQDPTPYWLVSSRRPDALAAAIEQGRRSVDQGAL